MASVYSDRLLAGQGLEGIHSAYCPEGVVWIVRDISWYSSGLVTLLGGYAGIYSGSLTVGILAMAQSDFAATSGHWSGRQVVGAGEGVFINIQSGNADVTISGYVLTLP